MTTAGWLYFGVTAGLFVIFAAIVVRTLSARRKTKLEEPKHRMLQDD